MTCSILSYKSEHKSSKSSFVILTNRSLLEIKFSTLIITSFDIDNNFLAFSHLIFNLL